MHVMIVKFKILNIYSNNLQWVVVVVDISRNVHMNLGDLSQIYDIKQHENSAH